MSITDFLLNKLYLLYIEFVFNIALKIKTPKWSTPTIIFIQDGTEVFGHQGYMTPKELYKALGIFLSLH
jgi:hypothetical protein